jgi:hypothetical protein
VYSITVYEQTGGVLPFTFLVNDPKIGKDPLFGQGSFDFTYFTGGTEVYDIYLSNNDGTPNMDGVFLTINCYRPLFDIGDSVANNIDAVSLDFDDGTHVWASVITAYTLGYNQPLTLSYLERALGSPDYNSTRIGDQFSSVTVGFNITPVPEPTTMVLLGSGLMGVWGFRRMFRN